MALPTDFLTNLLTLIQYLLRCVDIEGQVLNIRIEDVVAIFLLAEGDVEGSAEAVGSDDSEGLVALLVVGEVDAGRFEGNCRGLAGGGDSHISGWFLQGYVEG